jgi:DNA-binding transcriptional LysR family regulator
MTTMTLDALKVFQVVAQAQSFTKAAAKLGQDKSQVSRVVRALERSLKVVLLARTTRSVRLTAEGEALLHRVTPLLAGLEQALSAVPDQVDIPTGEVVVTTTPDLGRALLAPALVGFRLRFPSVRVRIVLAADFVDLMSEGVDLALRVGRPGGEALVARKVGELDAGFFASPAYLERRGTPQRLEQLGQHEGLWPTPQKGQKSFAPGPIASAPAVQCADFGLLAEVARAGGGVALLPTFLTERDVANGTLVRVLPGFSLGGAPLYVVSRPMRPLPPRVAALRSFLIETLTA